MKTCGVALVELLEANGIDHVFGIPGVHTIELYRGLPGSGIRHVTPRHEQGAGFMADGYARVAGKPAACFIVTGPGMTNIATAMGQAYGDSVPMLVVSGVNQRHELYLGQGRLHEVSDQQALMQHVAAFSHTLLRPDDLPEVLERGFAVMRGARPRPVHIEIPIDVFPLPADGMKTSEAASPSRPVPDTAAIAAACERLRGAERPVLLLGGGAVGAGDACRNLAETLGAPTTLTTNAKGLLAPEHPLLLGSYMASSSVSDCVGSSDVVLAIGTELGETDYGFDPFWTDGYLIRVDIDAEQTIRTLILCFACLGTLTLSAWTGASLSVFFRSGAYGLGMFAEVAMVRWEFNKSALDFEEIEAKLGKLEPTKVTLAEVMERLREKLNAQLARGVTVAQLRELLQGYGIELGEKTLRKDLETGKLPVKKATRQRVEAATEGESF